MNATVSRIALLLILCLASAAGFAATDPVMRRGFNADSVYDFSGIDAVDMFTGNLSLNIPLGQAYQSNGSLAYQFGLTYNSTIWDFYGQTAPGMALHLDTRQESYVTVRDFEATVSAIAGSEAYPALGSNAGLGWRFSLGDVFGGVLNNGSLVVRYVDASGADRTFFTQLHGPMGTDGDPLPGNGPFYSRDGSYLRLRRTDDANGVRVEIDSPDGLVRRFRCRTCGPQNLLAAQWTLDEIADPFGNLLVITRDNNSVRPSAAGAFWNWTFTEYSAGRDGYLSATSPNLGAPIRTHTAQFYVRKVYTALDGNGVSHELIAELQISSLTLAVCCNGATAQYLFGYEDLQVYRPPNNTWIGPHPILPDPDNDGAISLGILRRVILPDTTAGVAGSGGNWEFDYLGDSGADPIALSPRGPTLPPYSDFSGRLEAVAYPTGGGMRYEYDVRGFIKVACDPVYGSPMDGQRFQRFVTIARRQPVSKVARDEPDPARYDDGRGWLYTGAKYMLAVSQGPCRYQPLDFTTAVIDPSGRATVTYFQNFVGGTQGDWTHTEYGMPFTRYEADPIDPAGSPSGRFLSSEVYDCTAVNYLADPANAIRLSIPRFRRPIDTASGCEGPLRKTYVKFENSGIACDPADAFGECSHANRRIVSERTTYSDVCSIDTSPHCKVDLAPVTRWTLQESSQFDGLGHYRTNVSSGNFYDQAFHAEQWRMELDKRTSTTWYNHKVQYDNSTYTMSGRNLSQSLADWRLGTYSFTATTMRDKDAYGDRTEYTHFRFDPNTGFLDGWRKLKTNGGGAWPSPAEIADGKRLGDNQRHAEDVLMRQTRTHLSSNLLSQSENYYGGSVQKALANDALDATALPANTEYAMLRTLQSGAVKKNEYVCGPSPVLLLEENTIDPATGLVTSSRDAWLASKNKQTSYGYDVLGRLTSVAAPALATISYTYPSLLTPGDTTTVDMVQTSSDSTVGKAETHYVYDARGRLVTTKRAIKGLLNQTKRNYGDDQNLETQSNEGKGDAVDCPGSSENCLKYTNFTYDIFGRVLRAQPPESDPTEASRTVLTRYFGLQRKVTTAKGIANGYNTTKELSTTHSFDALGRLIKIDEPASATTQYAYDMADRLRSVKQDAQLRTFTYDGRGFLTDEAPSEVPQNIQYRDIDSRGHAHLRIVGTSGKFDLKYEFDRAERLTAVLGKVITGSSFVWEPVKQFTYENGKLKTAGRHNLVPPALATNIGATAYGVTTTYAYYDSGQLKSRTASAGFNAETVFTYNDLGLLKTLSYPRVRDYTCDGASCPPVGAARTVTYGYQSGALNSVTAGATPIVSSTVYHPNGLWSTLQRANSTRDTQNIRDDDPRPSARRAEAGAGAALWSADRIRYDGYGNVKRLDDANTFAYDDLGRLWKSNTGVVQEFLYDRHGNMTSMKRGGVTTTFGVSATTNRLQSISGTTVAPAYDQAGNLTSWVDPRRPGGPFAMTLAYDQFNMVKHAFLTGPAPRREFGRLYLYDADDERIGTIDYALKGADAPTQRETWSLRGANGEVLRDVVRDMRLVNGVKTWTWSWNRDYVYRGSALLAEIGNGSPETVRHMHLDHLGSVRAISGNNGAVVEQRKYLPFGEPLVSATATSRMAFAGHERDDDQSTFPYSDLDYMHARYYASVLGRMLSIDPIPGQASRPQSFNRYTYAQNRPLTLVDPTGLSAQESSDDDSLPTLTDIIQQALVGFVPPAPPAGMPAFSESITVVDVADTDPSFVGSVATGFADNMGRWFTLPYAHWRNGVINNDGGELARAGLGIAGRALLGRDVAALPRLVGRPVMWIGSTQAIRSAQTLRGGANNFPPYSVAERGEQALIDWEMQNLQRWIESGGRVVDLGRGMTITAPSLPYRMEQFVMHTFQ